MELIQILSKKQKLFQFADKLLLTNKILHNQKHQQNKTNKKRQHQSSIKKICHMVVSYSQGISESFKNICQKYGIQMHFKGGETIKNLLVQPKAKDNITKKSSVIYWFRCDRIDCEEGYIGESARTFGERYREHLRAPSPIHEHQNNTGHTTSVENFRIIGREDHNMARAVKEAMYIRVNNPTLNRYIRKYNQPHLWDRILHSIPELKISN